MFFFNHPVSRDHTFLMFKYKQSCLAAAGTRRYPSITINETNFFAVERFTIQLMHNI